MKSLLTLACALLLASSAQADTIDVQLINFSFVPAHVSIEVGDTVRWTHVSGGAHTVHEGPTQFPGPDSAFGQSVEPLFPVYEVEFSAEFLAQFPRSGDVYAYHCIPHWPGMAGTVTVTDNETGTEFCNGDGGDQMGCTNCPCMNNAMPGTSGGCLNSAGTSAELIASGSTSVSIPASSTSDLRFQLHGAPPTAFCILNSGDGVAPTNMANPCFGMSSGAQAAQFDGLRCAVTNTRRHGGRSADANGDVGVTGAPWGGEGGPPIGLALAFGGFSAGQTRFFQVINRDDALAVCMRALNTSQALEITFTP